VIVDTSAIVSIILDEPDRLNFEDAVSAAAELRMSAATLVEATLVLEGRAGAAGGALLERWVAGVGVEICPVTERTARLAQEGWRRYGKGRHKAALNLGDCFSYALAKDRDEALLFKGDDFAQTDVKAAI
jgi:ribonuclease VapC